VERADLSRLCKMWSERQLDTAVIHLSGEFDLSCTDAFFEELGRALDSETSALVLDLQALQFIDSTGLRMLLSLDSRAKSDGFDFTVRCRDGTVRRVLRETGLDGVLPVVDPSSRVPATDSAA
jgi:anti-sigma B factor antagonist